MRARLLCRLRPGETRSFPLGSEPRVLGREEGLALAVPLEDVSRRHAQISWDGKQHWLADLGSTNGTFLNGRPLGKQPEKLRHLSVISLGGAADLVYLVHAEETQPLLRSGILHAFLIRNLPDALPYEVAVGEFSVGRSPACNIVSESPDVSKQHARLTRSADKLIVRDLGSANGTWVNGVRIAEAPLADGDLVAFGSEEYQVSVAMGEVAAATPAGLEPVAVAPPPAEPARPTRRFSTDWKNRALGPLDKAVVALEAAGETTERGARGTAASADSTLQPQPTEAVAPGVEVRLSAPGIDAVLSTAGSHLLGSGPAAAFRVVHASVAEAHARIIVSELLGSVFIQREAGPTLRNGSPVERPEPLADGDVLRLGDVEVRVALKKL